MQKLAIDFGTSNTVVAAWNEADQAPRTLRLAPYSQAPQEDMPALIPSLLYMRNAQSGERLLGAQVRDQGLDVAGDSRFFAGFKRAVAADIPGYLPELDGVEVTPQAAGAWFLETLLAALPEAGYPLEELIFTVPVQAFERYLHWLQQVARAAGVSRLKLLDEATAAALGYGAMVPGALVLVCDFGGGTLDVSLVRMPEAARVGLTIAGEGAAELDRTRIAQVVAKAGAVLGGEDIDHWLLDDFLKRHGLDRNEVADDEHQLKHLAEQAKIRLSSQAQAELVYFHEERLKTYTTAYTRGELEDLLEAHDFYLKLQNALDQVLRQAEAKGVGRDEIAQVLLVGGTTLIPSVQRAIRQNFGANRVKAHAPFEAVAHGALQLLQGVQVEDFLYHGYGIRYWDPQSQRHRYEPILEPGHPYPSVQPVELVLRASRPAQPAIELVIGEFEPKPTLASEVVYQGGRLVATSMPMQDVRVVPLNDREGAKTIATLDPPGYPGLDRIRVIFSVDAERRLRLTVHDLQTSRCLLEDAAVLELR